MRVPFPKVIKSVPVFWIFLWIFVLFLSCFLIFWKSHSLPSMSPNMPCLWSDMSFLHISEEILWIAFKKILKLDSMPVICLVRACLWLLTPKQMVQIKNFLEYHLQFSFCKHVWVFYFYAHSCLYGCYLPVSVEHTAKVCKKRRICKIFSKKHQTLLHGYVPKWKGGGIVGYNKEGDDDIVKTSFAASKTIILCVVSIKFNHMKTSFNICNACQLY